MAYCIDLHSRKPQIMSFDGDELKMDMKFFKVSSPLGLNTFDRRVFLDFHSADLFFYEYSKITHFLDNRKICKSRELPSLRYKRRYIVLSMMGLKNITYRKTHLMKKVIGSNGRTYKEKIGVGDLINFHDQVFFLTVKIKSITKIKGEYCYKYDVVK